ncbi:glycosyltransferase family 87 protein [Ovoidimarina sediminis]|uniref:glycosyltransferase family 87 protein n=1 Tax=Ovoidimarina sediminis TaxID=3079856 RepID=UPI002909FB27|nr:glycosyltransferase family 87 protein [Rhodophyticola sp. MJ-SS7]MDU8943004.1 glycosyltransferase family 87 protein [Rhodophyticola sp. MJ-SS7]
MTRQTLGLMALICACAAFSAVRFWGVNSPDLLATWMAGVSFARGDHSAVYPQLGEVFTMRPPEAWITELRSDGYDGAIFPFIYPPLWAWVTGHFSRLAEYENFVRVATVVNPVLLGLTLWLAARLAAGRLGAMAFVAIGVVLFASTTIVLGALEQNQPQILVAFLTVLAIERTRSGAAVTGGVALAIAASLKLYPALFALFWLARGERRAAASFALAGAGLGLLSIAVAGWPLHAEFLAQIRTISNTVLVTVFSHSADPVLGQFVFPANLTPVESLASGAPGGWLVMAKPPVWAALNTAAILVALAGLAALARSRFGADPLFWPLAITVIALLSPLSWGYHYIAAIAFVPALIDRLGSGPGLVTCLVLLAPTSVPYVFSDLPVLAFDAYAGLLGTLAMALYAALLLAMITGRLPVRREALAPA